MKHDKIGRTSGALYPGAAHDVLDMSMTYLQVFDMGSRNGRFTDADIRGLERRLATGAPFNIEWRRPNEHSNGNWTEVDEPCAFPGCEEPRRLTATPSRYCLDHADQNVRRRKTRKSRAS